MKTLGYIDRYDGNRRLKIFSVAYAPSETKYTWLDRIKEAFWEIKGLGNVDLYFIRGNKIRKIATRAI